MSAGMSAKSPVLRYRSPVSGNIASTVDPLGASAHTFIAAPNVPPAETPTKIPSCAASFLLHWTASGAGIVMMRSTYFAAIASPVSFGMKSGLQPWIGCGFHEAGDWDWRLATEP